MRKTVDLRALVLALVLVAPSLAWICVDRHVWPWDQALYGEVSCDLWFSLTHSMAEWIRVMITALGQKPPAAVWIGQFFVPLGAVLPSIESALLVSIVATQAATLVLLALVFREIDPESRWGWAIGCAFAGSAPLFAGLSHQFFTEPLQALTVAWAYLIAVRAFKLPRAGIIAQLVCCGLLGLLAKSSTPLFMMAPFLLALRGLFGPQPWLPEPGRRRGFAAWVVIGAALLAATGVWYGVNFRAMFAHALKSSVDSVALDYGWKDTFWNKVGAWGRLTARALFGPGVLWAALACTAAGAWMARHGRPRGPRLLIALGAVAQLAIVIAAFSSVVTVETRYLLAVVPTVAVLVFLAATLARTPVIAALWMAVMLWQWGSTFAAAFGLVVWPDQTTWLIAVDADPGHSCELARVVQMTAPQTAAPFYNVTGIELPWINANSAAFYAAKDRLRTGRRAVYTSLGYAERDSEAAWKRIGDLHTQYFISMAPERQPKPPNFLNLVAIPMLERVERAQEFHRVPFESRYGIAVFERVPPPVRTERGSLRYSTP